MDKRRQFDLPERDAEFLDSNGYNWEAINGNGNWVIIHDYPIPNGYNLSKTIVALRIDPGYPSTQIDMVYFYPNLIRKDGHPIGAITGCAIDGSIYQRWSRHRTGFNPWRPEVDDLSTHLGLVNYWLEREFKLR